MLRSKPAQCVSSPRLLLLCSCCACSDGEIISSADKLPQDLEREIRSRERQAQQEMKAKPLQHFKAIALDSESLLVNRSC